MTVTQPSASVNDTSRQSARGSDWPFLTEPPSDRFDLQKSLVEGDPFFRLLGLTVRELRQDAASLVLSVRPDLVQPTGILHGGLHSILIDSAIAQAFLTTIRPGFSVVTLHLDTKYFAPVRSGQVCAEATVVRKGMRIAHGEARVLDAAGNVLAHGWGVFAVVAIGRA